MKGGVCVLVFLGVQPWEEDYLNILEDLRRRVRLFDGLEKLLGGHMLWDDDLIPDTLKDMGAGFVLLTVRTGWGCVGIYICLLFPSVLPS